MNWYAYVGNDPVNMTDPSGLDGAPGSSCFVGSAGCDGHATFPDFAVTASNCAYGATCYSPGQLQGACGVLCTMLGGSVSMYTPTGQVAGQYDRGTFLGGATVAGGIFEVGEMFLPSGWSGKAKGARGVGIVLEKRACFEAGTLVQTKDGLRPIEQIKVGDLVLSRDPVTGKTAYKPVVALKPTQDKTIWEVELEVRSANGVVRREVLRTTEEHPFRTINGEWTQTTDLNPGASVVRADSEPAKVVSVVRTARVAPTYNFEVEGFHTYFVGEEQVWVHNSCDKTITGLFKQLQKHYAKLDKFKANPTVHPAMRGMSQEAIQAQQARRIELLGDQIQGFQNEIIKRMQMW